MALFDFLKRKKEIEKSREKKPAKFLAPKEREQKKVKPTYMPAGRTKKTSDFSYEIVKEPHISEKSANMAEKNNKYVFKIYGSANKSETKKSVEGIYGVDVLSVNIARIPGKKRRIGRTEGFKKGYRKAIVTIKEGQKIELL